MHNEMSSLKPSHPLLQPSKGDLEGGGVVDYKSRGSSMITTLRGMELEGLWTSHEEVSSRLHYVKTIIYKCQAAYSNNYSFSFSHFGCHDECFHVYLISLAGEINKIAQLMNDGGG